MYCVITRNYNKCNFNPFTAQWLIYIPPGLIFKFLRSAHTVYLCVLYGFQNKQPLFPHTAPIDWFYNRDWSCLLRGTN